MKQDVLEIAAAGFLYNIGKLENFDVQNKELLEKYKDYIETANAIAGAMNNTPANGANDKRLISIFSEIGSTKTPWFYPVRKFSIKDIKNIFPEKNTSAANKDENYYSTFQNELTPLLDNISGKFKEIDEISKEYLTFVSSATVKTDIKADISLYDHARTTSAIAQALYVYHTQNNKSVIAGKIEKDKEPKFLYFKAKFNGIQNFIFATGSQTNKNAAKILRGRSFYVSLMMKRTADMLCEKLGLAHTAIIMNAAGAVTAILPNTKEVKDKLKEIKDTINDWLIEKFYGEVSVSFAYVETSHKDLLSSLEEISKKIRKNLEIAKFKKLPLKKLGVIQSYFKDGQTPCPYCGKRPNTKGNMCDICTDLNGIGKNIPKKNEIKDITPIFDKYNEVYESDYDDLYVPVKENGKENREVKTFDDIVNGGKGIEVLGILKADVDNLGTMFSNVAEAGGLSRQVTLSRMLDAFWTMWLPNELKSGNDGKFSNIYTVFSGGDDLFLIGRWDTVIEFALHLNDKFKQFTCNNSDITFSAGIAFVKCGEPIETFYRLSEEALETSKNYVLDDKPCKSDKNDTSQQNPQKETKKTKNALTLFGETIPWDKKGKQEPKDDNVKYDTTTLWGCYQDIKRLIERNKLNSGALYKLMSFIDMAKKTDRIKEPKKGDKFAYKDMQAFKWRALLTYFIARNKEFENDKNKQDKINQFIKQIEDNRNSQRSILKAMLWRNIYENRERRK